MRRLFKLSTFCLIAAVASACSTPDVVIPTEDIPTGGVRFINAVPNAPWGSGATGSGLDFRFIDNPENNAQWQMPFRNGAIVSGGVSSAAATEYKPARAGVRKFRVFPNDTLQSVASTIIFDQTITIDAGHNYSVIVMGLAGVTTGADALRLVIVDETVATPAAGKYALRLYNTSGIAVDGRAWLVGTAIPATATFASVPAYTASTTYVPLDTGAYVFNVRAAGSANSLTCDVRSILGANAVTTGAGPFDAIPGSRANQSALSVFVFPGSVAGTKSAQFNTTTGSIAMAATVAGYSVPAGRSLLADCFVVGQTVNVTGFATAGNNGATTITGIPEATTGSTTLGAIVGGYTRPAGSFITNGFVVGQTLTASGFATAANNGTSIITSVTATTITVTKATPPVVEADAAARTLVGNGLLEVAKVLTPDASATGRTISLSAPGAAFVWDKRPPRPSGV